MDKRLIRTPGQMHGGNSLNISDGSATRGYTEFIPSYSLKEGEWIDSKGWIHYPNIEGRRVLTFGKSARRK